jgi:tetratricopeptide (TPR) repeat protein
LWGNVLQVQGDQSGAIMKFQQSIALDPQGSPAYSNLFSLLLETGQRDAANALLDRAAAIPHPTPAVLTGVGDIYVSLGKFDVALKTYERAAKIDPSNAGPRLALAIVYYQLRRYDDAERAVEDTIDRQPIPLAYLISLGLALERGRVEDARIRAEQVNSIAPASGAGAIANGWVRIAEHRYAEAVSLFERGVTGNGAFDPYNWYGYGRALAGDGQYERALEQYQRGLALMPMVEALTYQGTALAALGRDDAALASFAEAEKVGPRYARLYEQWARVLEKAGRKSDAAAKHAKAESLAKEQRVVINE